MRRGTIACLLAALLALACCGTYPTDPEGTLERVRGGTLRVGASVNGDWVRIPEGGSSPARVGGAEADLVRQFAEQLGAEVEWVQGTEHVLAEELKHGTLDMVIGGLDDKTPWSTHAGLTRPYTESKDVRGSLHKHVMLVPLGENAFLLELDRFLLESGQS
jgi:hypothetical protein